MSTAESAAQSSIELLRSEMADAKARHAIVIAELEAELIGLEYESSESFKELMDKLSADLGAQAANDCSNPSDQDAAISICETFVSNEISLSSMNAVVAAVAFYGPHDAAEQINKVVSDSPLRESPFAGR